MKSSKKKFSKMSRGKKIAIFAGMALLILLLFGLWRVNSFTNTISTEGSLFKSIGKKITASGDGLKGEADGRINIALMGMRGVGVEGGGLLADTIMVVSVIRNDDPAATSPYKLGIVSVPRDLLVQSPDGSYGKINSVLFKGERQEIGGGIDAMKFALSEVVGQEIHYGVTINFEGFNDIIDTLGGVDVNLSEPFREPLQFNEVHVCDGDKGGVFKVPTGEMQKKYKKNGDISVEYPLCFNSSPECGGVFELPAGEQVLTGEQALCYVRSRVTSSDFDRARRQQEVLTNLQTKVVSADFLTDLSRVNDMMKILGDNMQMDLELWELEKFFGIYKGLGGAPVVQEVLDDRNDGYLYAPSRESAFGAEFGYILRPKNEDYTEIHALFDSFTTK